MNEEHKNKRIELIQKQSEKAKRIHELLKNDLISEDEVIELQDLLSRSRISRDGLIKLVCDMRQALISPMDKLVFTDFLIKAKTVINSHIGTENGKKGSRERQSTIDTEIVNGIWKIHYKAIYDRTYRSQYLVIPETGGIGVFAKDMAKKYDVKEASIKSSSSKWKTALLKK
jgi:hypothetical protein